MKIYGLYGKSGTGKSHKAQVLACRLGVQAIIDDGILILNQTHVAGVSAKCEKYLYSATKRAIFYWDGPRDDVKNFISDAKIADLIILGTSQKMILQILNRLELPLTLEWVSIHSLQSNAETNLATKKRQEGYHAIPIKPINVTKTFVGWYEGLNLDYDYCRTEITLVKPFI
jgi:ABC-type dipeptide/oligopeptide/nickel transport system ATPase component